MSCRLAMALLAGLLACRPVTAEPAASTADAVLSQRSLFDTYQMCATLGLPEDFRAVRDAEAAATAAVDQCRIERLALAGQYALDNPGTRDTPRFLGRQRLRVIDTLSHWVVASTQGVVPHPLTPVSTGKHKPAHIPRSR